MMASRITTVTQLLEEQQQPCMPAATAAGSTASSLSAAWTTRGGNTIGNGGATVVQRPSSSFGGLRKGARAVALVATGLLKAVVYSVCLFALFVALILLLDHEQRAEPRYE